MKLSLREHRALTELVQYPMMRKGLDLIVGCSNTPELIAGLRRKGLSIPCGRLQVFDKDRKACYPGLYCITETDKQKVLEWIKESL
jgi:hypothetical protein